MKTAAGSGTHCVKQWGWIIPRGSVDPGHGGAHNRCQRRRKKAGTQCKGSRGKKNANHEKGEKKQKPIKAGDGRDAIWEKTQIKITGPGIP